MLNSTDKEAVFEVQPGSHVNESLLQNSDWVSCSVTGLEVSVIIECVYYTEET